MWTKIAIFFALFLSVIGIIGGIEYLFYYRQPVIAFALIIVGVIYIREFFPRWVKILMKE